MGRSTKHGKHTADVAPPKRKRKRRARTDVSSSSESSSDSSSSGSESGVEAKKSKGKKKADAEEVEMMDAPPVAEDPDSEVDLSDAEEAEEETVKGKAFTEKSGRIPSPLRELHDPQANAKFEEYYMRLITTEFGDDLNALRQAKDFGDKSLPMLVRALRQGVNIFDKEERRVVIGGGSGSTQ